jgi:hypothetical protein
MTLRFAKANWDLGVLKLLDDTLVPAYPRPITVIISTREHVGQAYISCRWEDNHISKVSELFPPYRPSSLNIRGQKSGQASNKNINSVEKRGREACTGILPSCRKANVNFVWLQDAVWIRDTIEIG